MRSVHQNQISLNIVFQYLSDCYISDGKIGDPRNKNGYIQCTGGVGVKVNCPDRHYWADFRKKCVRPGKADYNWKVLARNDYNSEIRSLKEESRLKVGLTV